MPAIPRNPRYWSDRVDEDSDFAQITPLGENKYQVRLKSLSWFFVSHGNYGLNLWAPVKPDNQRFSYCVKGEVK